MTESARSGQVPFVLASKPLTSDPETANPRDSAQSTLFSRIFVEQFRYVYNTLRRLGVHAVDIEDSTHEVFLAVYRHLAEWEPDRPIRPWLFAFAYRVASAYRRQARHRRETTTLDHETASVARDSLEQLVQAQHLALVHSALLAIDLDHRAVFILHVLDETPMPQTAQALGIPLNTGYSRLRAARRKFDSALQRLQPRGGR